ncbi:MAG: prepilin-type N-terminal cleavage/methylation domain-containing protein [Chlorobium sp.]|nr:prepilin-type N-terminal cleavage/methylation domain-containing protein [Chlorobium sp.]
MNMQSLLKNQKGMTLIEAMIAIAILTIGIMAAMGMQVRAIGASSTALYRTDANNIAISLLETLKELPFDDANLADTVASPNALYVAANFPRMAPFIASVPAAGSIVDRSGITYNLSWTVQDRAVSATNTPSKIISVFMTWNSTMGQNRVEMTTTKYKNIKL